MMDILYEDKFDFIKSEDKQFINEFNQRMTELEPCFG